MKKLAIALLGLLLAGCESTVADVANELQAECKRLGGDAIEYPPSAPAITYDSKIDIRDCAKYGKEGRNVVAVFVVSGEKPNRTWMVR